MIDIQTQRPGSGDPAEGRPAYRSAIHRVADRIGLSRRTRDVSETEHMMADFAGVLTSVRDCGELAAGLARVAQGMVGGWASATLTRGEGAFRVSSVWPPPDPPLASTTRTAPATVAETQNAPTAERLQFPLAIRGRTYGKLTVEPSPSFHASPEVIARLKTLATLAAAAMAGTPGRAAGRIDGETPEVTDSVFELVLSPMLVQSDRRHEPATLFYVQIDLLDAIRQLNGPAVADEAVRRAETAVRTALRASDIVMRLPDGRVAAILPNASAADSQTVANAVRALVSKANGHREDMPALTVTVGVASYPECAHDAQALHMAAIVALDRSKVLGRDRVQCAPRVNQGIQPGAAMSSAG
ncbi:diguanylate cyclase [Isosphaeraceae bacterium EP7]